jgi:FMN-dependent NADH-azoreductase
MNILYVTSSLRGGASYSGQTGERVLAELREHNPNAQVVVRDLAKNPLPHIDGDFVAATRGPNGATTELQRGLLAQSDVLVDELFAADVIVIATGMVNFSIPSTLKAWLDYIARPGRTFSYSEAGPKGLVTGKQVVLIAASGGVYADKRPLDFQVPYLKHVLGFLGMTEIEVLDVGGTAFGADAAAQAVEAATQQLHARCTEARAVA